MHAIDLRTFEESGLYLRPEKQQWLILTRKEIESRMQRMLDDPHAIPTASRAAAEYQPCDICPEKDTAIICHAIMTTLPFTMEIDRYLSCDSVLAVYREPPTVDNTPGGIYIRKTSMQEALQYISILSLMFYCEVGKKYYSCFDNINPLMPGETLGKTIFANMFLQCRGDRSALQTFLDEMTSELLLTAKCQVKRLQLISKNDAFINAIIRTHTTVQSLLHTLQDLCSSIPE